MKKRLLFGIFAGLILSLLSLYPQMNLRSLRGNEYHGVFASCDLDEMAYAAYLQALIDGRPRKSDPYTGRDTSASDRQPESLFSIQFLPAYLSAWPARILGLSAQQMMPVISVFSAFFTAVALFWLIVSITGDEVLALAGTLIVMVGSAAITGIGAINGFFEGGVAYPFFPFLRRPIPSVAFPFLFGFLACLWNGMRAETTRRRWIYSALSVFLFASLVFSYFYLWTSAAAVLAGLVLFTIVFRSETWRRDAIFLLQTGVLCFIPLGVYAFLLAGRNQMADKAQLLVFTHSPDINRMVEIIGVVILAGCSLAAWRKYRDVTGRTIVFVAAFALSPIPVFNQQILSGRSLQPFHYEFYVINYIVLLGAVLLVAIIWRQFLGPHKTVSFTLLVILIATSMVWGYVEATETTAFWNDTNVQRDEAMPVNLRLRELAGNNIDAAKLLATVNLESLQADGQPTVAPQAVLWARHQGTFAGIRSWDENKLRYYKLLYYSDMDGNWLRKALTGCSDIEACMALFGWDRFNARLSSNAHPLTLEEIEAEVSNFDEFSRNFSETESREPQLSYLVVYTEGRNTLRNLGRWYEIGEGEIYGKYTLYRLDARQ